MTRDMKQKFNDIFFTNTFSLALAYLKLDCGPIMILVLA